jgi:hypothetical protein
MIIASLPTIGIVILAAVVALVFFAAGWVLADARSRGKPRRVKATKIE